MTPAQILTGAAGVIEERGWHRGSYYDAAARRQAQRPLEECPVCVLGAVNVAAGRAPDDPNYSVEEIQALVALADHLGLSRSHDLLALIPEWNDHDADDANQVVNALRTAARAA